MRHGREPSLKPTVYRSRTGASSGPVQYQKLAKFPPEMYAERPMSSEVKMSKYIYEMIPQELLAGSRELLTFAKMLLFPRQRQN